MIDNIERRKHKRLPIQLNLHVNKLFKQDNIKIEGKQADIEVLDISKTGIKFVCNKLLPIGYYFDTKIQLTENDFFYAVIRIVRVNEEKENEYNYGAEFIGLAPFLANKIDDYERKL